MNRKMKRIGLGWIVASALTSSAGDPLWMDRAKAPEERARLLTAEMTLEEKAGF